MNSTNVININDFHRVNDYQFDADLTKVYMAFKEKPMTMKEANFHIGQLCKNICLYIAILLIQGRISVIKERKCTITGFSNINVYTGNSNLLPKSNQLKIS